MGLCIDRLVSGGIITNYSCSSRCAHCMYACSPDRERGYIDRSTLESNLEKIKELGCTSVHIGGGEPFIDTDGLEMVVATSVKAGVEIEYVETNSSWFADMTSATRILSRLRKCGLTHLLVSISPFHNEHIPFFKVKGVIEACRHTGIAVYPWVMELISEIDSFDDRTVHPLEEYISRFGSDYIRKIRGRYWVHLGGRAIGTFAAVNGLSRLESILRKNATGCRELAQTGHFHMDLDGKYIPGLCVGLTIEGSDLGRELSPEKYPLTDLLFKGGVGALLEEARMNHGFKPGETYLNKCHLCTDIRSFIAKGRTSTELGPAGFYEEI